MPSFHLPPHIRGHFEASRAVPAVHLDAHEETRHVGPPTAVVTRDHSRHQGRLQKPGTRGPSKLNRPMAPRLIECPHHCGNRGEKELLRGVDPRCRERLVDVTLGPVTVGDVNEIDELERSVDGCGAAQALGAGAGPDPAPPRPPGCRCSPGPSCAPTEGGLLFEGRHPRRLLPPGCAALKSFHPLSL